MAYKIQYTPQDAKRYPKIRKKTDLPWRKMALVLFLIAGMLLTRIHGVPDFLIPGDAQVTKSAANRMIEALREGESVNDAVTVFCRQVLDAASA